ncbi:MAG: NAD(P)/FAD-dependent oxidoreductase [Pseudomonadota bacterium]
MHDDDKIDLIVVGGGLAGLLGAIEAAQKELSVLLIERGEHCGSKNLSGGRLYLNPLKKVLSPEAFSILLEAPFERPVTKEILMLSTQHGSMKFELDAERFSGETPHSVTVQRAVFDKWLAAKAEELGVMIVPESRVDEIILNEDGTAGGAKVGDELLESDYVLIAEGALGRLAGRMGLAPARDAESGADEAFLGVKETIKLDSGKIEDRFNLARGEGAAAMMAGTLTRGMVGGGFLYTNRESLSLGIVLHLGGVARKHEKGFEPWQILDELKRRKEIAVLVEGGKTAEYGAHLIPELHTLEGRRWGEKNIMVAGDAAGFVLNQLITVRGMDLAIASGSLAGQSAAEAKKSGDRSAAAGIYEKKLEGSFVMRDLRQAVNMHRFSGNKDIFTRYPEIMFDVLEEVYTTGEEGKSRFMGGALKRIRKEALSWEGIKTYMKLRKL